MDLEASRRGVMLGLAALPAAAHAAKASLRHRATSPDGRVEVELHTGPLGWSVRYNGRPILTRSPLALRLAEAAVLGPQAISTASSTRQIKGNWSPPFGIRAVSTEACGEITVTLQDRASAITFAAVARAYDAGVAIRFHLIKAPGPSVVVTGEAIEFRLPADAVVHASRDEGEYQTTHQTAVSPIPEPALTASCDPPGLADVPLTAQLGDGTTVVITESDRLHYPRMMLKSTEHGLTTRLMQYPGRATGYSGPGDTEAEDHFTLAEGAQTPWRVIVLSPDPAGLLERQDLIPTLASPNRLGDVSWVKPGRAIRIRGFTTQAGLDTVDFAAARRLDYVEWDAHWYGDGTDPSDATYAIPAIDIRKVVDYARSKGLGMILYVDRVPAMRQLDAILKTYRSWGVAGIKFGFVWEGRQSDVDFITNLVRACGEHGLLVNLHDNLRPAGLERTYPNYIALEGVRGNEHFPTAAHNCTLPFTRAIAGPIDYTICYANPRNRTTNAHQLAMAAVYYNPLTFLYWYDGPEKYAGRNWPELAFFDECPTSWDRTVALSGAIGQHVVVARRNKGRWYLGALTNEQGRDLTVPLHFLEKGRWRARRFADGLPGAQAMATPVILSEDIVTPHQSLTLRLAPSGGQAIIFEPA
ncbi:alpha-glucosidase [Novosphingobium sp. SG751A]|uniref:glycoside hydrolase family 97 protein n=1 Tax=Novosphingobium sp. SG751A TaxID=2587000 RepID=UPI0015556649|nr:glycoside hydrolase family 97 protein [Novosphingobium sp. SG751A]NOW48442.1 alpha-glucosidase [Novosphingobium sp. SG751A]